MDSLIGAFSNSRFAIEPYNITPSPTLELSLTPPLCLTTIPNQLLETFMKIYVGTAWSILPIQTPAQLGALFALSCTAFSQNNPPPALYPIILYQLAMGSMFTTQGQLADLLVQESDLFMSAGAHLSEALELQLYILMMQYHSESGNFEKTYSILGTVASKVYAAGFHLEPRSPEIEKLIPILLSSERFACIALGRPPLLSPSIQVSENNQSTDSKFFSGIFDILCSSIRVQQSPVTSLDDLWDSIWATQARLSAFWEANEPLLRFPHADPHRPWGVGEAVALNSVVYEYAILTNLKPVLLYIGHKRAPLKQSPSPSPGPSHSFQSSHSTSLTTRFPLRRTPNPTKSNPEIIKACDYILSYAKKMIGTISDIQRSGSHAKDLPMNSFFLESACTALIAYGAWYDNAGAVLDSIDVGIQCLEALQYQRAAVHRLANVKKAVEQSGLRRI
ncbi:fungal specific transcription factor domain-containing protein [Aspergillus undulatus]|uniref:fungal specific transcription factor domain-containing protein n=1 Tax=Aspergillus undulatus TaxID=1810928 RepID=UPI003CCC9779